MSENEFTMPSGETARLVPGFPAYAVTRNGKAWSRAKRGWKGGLESTWRLLKTANDVQGYLFVSTGKGHQQYVHRLVLLCYIGPKPAHLETRHLDGDRTNNRLGNLAYGTPQENAADRIRHGRVPAGSSHYNSRLTEEAVIDIRKRVMEGEIITHLSTEYGVSVGVAWNAASGGTWKHVPGAVPASLRMDKGERHASAKLTDVAVADIRQRAAVGEAPKLLALRYGVGVGAIYDVVNRKTWEHVA